MSKLHILAEETVTWPENGLINSLDEVTISVRTYLSETYVQVTGNHKGEHRTSHSLTFEAARILAAALYGMTEPNSTAMPEKAADPSIPKDDFNKTGFLPGDLVQWNGHDGGYECNGCLVYGRTSFRGVPMISIAPFPGGGIKVVNAYDLTLIKREWRPRRWFDA